MESLRKFYTFKEERYFDSVRKEIEPLLPEKIDKVLEIGCGSGATLEWLKREKGCIWVGGIELNKAVSFYAEKQLDFFMNANIENIDLPFNKNTFDVILCLDVLEHLIDPWIVVTKLSRLIKPGGVLIVSLPNILHISALIPLLLKDRWDYAPSGILDKTHLRFFTKKTSIELLENGGLCVEKVIPHLPHKKGSKTWLFNLFTLSIFKRFLTTQYLIRGTPKEFI